MKLTKNLRMFGIAMALIGITAVQSFALPANEKETVYFSDATMTNEVGYEYRGCNGGVSLKEDGPGTQLPHLLLAIAPAQSRWPVTLMAD